VGEITARSAAQRLRLSVTYALLDASPVILPEHVLAAEAVLRYCAGSVEHVFGSLRKDTVETCLLQGLRVHPDGLDGRGQYALFGRHITGDRLATARSALERCCLIRTVYETTGGRDRLRSFALPLRTSEQMRTNKSDELFVRLNSLVRGTRGTE
jgi:hypothetical protein